MKRYVLITLFLGLGLTLSGCNTLLTATRDQPIDDNRGTRTLGSKVDDPVIETKVAVNIAKAHPDLKDASRIVVVSYNGIVLVAGQTPRSELKTLAGQTASKVQKVRKVHNELQITPPAGMLARSNDSWITSKIKSQMLFDSEVPSSRVKVVTENGIVYLMGLLTRQEADQATRVAQGVSGVQKIVRVFEYID